MAFPGSSQQALSPRKISQDKILNLNFNTSQRYNEKIKVISISCDYYWEIEVLLILLDLEKYPNAFVIIINVKSKENLVERIRQKVDEKFPKIRQILLKIQSSNYVRRKVGNLYKIDQNLTKAEIEENLKGLKFTTEIFLNILKCFDVDFNELLKYEKNAENLFLNAIKSGDFFCLQLLNLFDFDFSTNIQRKILKSISDSENFENFLLHFSSFDRSRFNLRELDGITQPRELFSKIFEIQNFHENIESGNLKKVKKFSIENSNLKLCYGLSETCALELAIDSKQLKIYSFLRASNFYTDRGSQLEDKISKLSKSQKEEIRIENLNYIQEVPNAFIGILLSKCKFDALSPISSQDVHEMLIELGQNESLKPFLQVAAQANLTIIFDFATESVKNMVPDCDEHVMGLAYFVRGELYVGRDRERFLRFGSFIHELSHMVFNLVYENDCLPYCKGDTEREREWARILENEREFYEANVEELDPIIRWVFQCYDVGYPQKAELAVRPNHIMARYHGNQERIQELQREHAELFNFIENCVLPDIKTPNFLEMIELNYDFEFFENIKELKLTLKATSTPEILNELDNKLILKSNVPKLAFLKLFNEIKSVTRNIHSLKVKNIFIDPEKLRNKHLAKKLLNAVKNFEIEHIIVDLTDAKEDQNILELIKEFPSELKIILVCSEENSEKFQFKKFQKNFTFDDLSDLCQAQLQRRKIKFQGKNFQCSNFFHMAQSEIFPLLCEGKEVLINCKHQEKSESYFISRIIIDSLGKEYKFDDFIEEVHDQRIVLISDVCGSGKTSLLKKVYEDFLVEDSKFWISFVKLIDHKNDLSKIDEDNFEKKIANMLKLNKLEEKIFFHKLLEGEMRIFFDGFDEISPSCKEETLKLFNFLKTNTKIQFWVSTRTHLEFDLENELNVKSFKLKVFNESDQIKFLCNFWKNSHKDESFIETCAHQLTQKILKIIENVPNLIGIPMIIQSVAKIFVNKINESFPNEIRNLKLFDIFSQIFEECLNISNKLHTSILTKRLSPIQVHEYFAIIYFFDHNFAKLLGLIHDEREFPLEEISRYGLVTYSKEGQVSFTHQIYAEFLLANFLIWLIFNLNKLKDEHKKLLKLALSEERFKISRTFFDESLETLEQNPPKIEGPIKDFDILELILTRKHQNLFENFWNCELLYCDISHRRLFHIAESIKMLDEELFRKVFFIIFSHDNDFGFFNLFPCFYFLFLKSMFVMHLLSFIHSASSLSFPSSFSLAYVLISSIAAHKIFKPQHSFAQFKYFLNILQKNYNSCDRYGSFRMDFMCKMLLVGFWIFLIFFCKCIIFFFGVPARSTTDEPPEYIYLIVICNFLILFIYKKFKNMYISLFSGVRFDSRNYSKLALFGDKCLLWIAPSIYLFYLFVQKCFEFN